MASNGWRSDSGSESLADVERSPRPHKVPPSRNGSFAYRAECLGFISRVSEPQPEGTVIRLYGLRDGIHKPNFCQHFATLRIESVDREPLSAQNDDRRHDYLYKLLKRKSFIRMRTGWGFRMNNVLSRICIPPSMRVVHEQQMHMSPVIQFINWHPEKFDAFKPHFVSNRHILKKIMVVENPGDTCIFLAERRRGTIYLRDEHLAQRPRNRTKRSAANRVTSFLLTRSSEETAQPFDTNEAVYGVYAGYIGHDNDIRILFSAEIDGFWPSDRSCELSLDDDGHGGIQKRVVEIKTMTAELWRDNCLGRWQSRMVAMWVQCFLVNCKDILCGILETPRGDIVREVQFYDVDKILDYVLRARDSPGVSDQGSFYTDRLRTVLEKVLATLTEETPATYKVTVEHDLRNNYTTTEVTKTNLAPFTNFPSFA